MVDFEKELLKSDLAETQAAVDKAHRSLAKQAMKMAEMNEKIHALAEALKEMVYQFEDCAKFTEQIQVLEYSKKKLKALDMLDKE